MGGVVTPAECHNTLAQCSIPCFSYSFYQLDLAIFMGEFLPPLEVSSFVIGLCRAKTPPHKPAISCVHSAMSLLTSRQNSLMETSLIL